MRQLIRQSLQQLNFISKIGGKRFESNEETICDVSRYFDELYKDSINVLETNFIRILFLYN